MPAGPEMVADDDWLLRRIPPWHQPQLYQTTDAEAPRMRPPSDAFSLEKDEVGLSFHIESSLRNAGEPLTYGCPANQAGWAVARVSAARVRELGLRLERDGRAHHVIAVGLADLGSSARRRLQRELAKASDYVVPPRSA